MTGNNTCMAQSPPRYKYPISGNADKDERKREYNRLAQREFRRRRKEHLKNLERGRVSRTSEQVSEIDRLRRENEDLKRELRMLKQMYAMESSMSNASITTLPTNSYDRTYSSSPSITSTMGSITEAGSPPADMMSTRSMSTSVTMLPPPMQAFLDPTIMPSMTSTQQYYMETHQDIAQWDQLFSL